MLKQMDKLRHPIRALSSWSKERSMSILGVGMKSYQRHCGHSVFRATERRKLHLITWCMDRRLYYRKRLRPARDA
jgi:hypothetical protein